MAQTTERYTPGLGRRKEATAQVRLIPNGSGKIIVNDRELAAYFPVYSLQQVVKAPLTAAGAEGKFDVSVKVLGGGIHGQADSVRLGIARALVSFNPDYRTSLKKLGHLKRDARVRERKKYGKKSARRSPQWAKR
jgi:small subunit ribosomal protein S9